MTGYFVDENGFLQACNEVDCRVVDTVVQVLGDKEPDGSQEVVGEFSWYPTLASIRGMHRYSFEIKVDWRSR